MGGFHAQWETTVLRDFSQLILQCKDWKRADSSESELLTKQQPEWQKNEASADLPKIIVPPKASWGRLHTQDSVPPSHVFSYENNVFTSWYKMLVSVVQIAIAIIS